MRLPSNRRERHDLYRDLLRRCDVSRDDRRERYRRLRLAYLNGSPDGATVRSNRLARHVRWSSSYLFAPDSVRWGVVLPPHYGEEWLGELSAAREELTRLWHDSDAGGTANMCVRWAHVYDTIIAKVIVSEDEPKLYMVSDTSDVGVLDEAIHEWDRQEALCHWFTVDLATFQRMVSVLPDVERRIKLLEYAAQHSTRPGGAEGHTLPPTLERVLIAASTPNMIGVARAAADTTIASPHSDEPVIQLAELWVRDDEAREWRVATFLVPESIIWDPLNPLNPGEHPFHELQLDPTPGYAWGKAPLTDLIPLQEWREQKIADLDEREGRQIDPPAFFKGFATVDGEKAKLFRRRGGTIATNVPNAEVQMFSPPPLPEPFSMVHEIDSEFAQDGDLPRSLMGQADPGGAQSRDPMAQAALGSGPTLVKAMLVESWLQDIATAQLRLHRRISGRTIKKATGSEFLLAQMPADVIARVWAHSASPLYAQQVLQKALIANERGAIDNEDLLLYLDLPMTEALLHKQRHLAEAKAKEHERAISIKEQEAKAKVLRAVK